MRAHVHVSKIDDYDEDLIYANLDDTIFESINKTDTVVIKPNWVKESHLYKPGEWDYIITHPTVITAVLRKVIDRLSDGARIIITDGPQTDSSFAKIISHYPVEKWKNLASKNNIHFEIIDLRDDEWINKGDVNIRRIKLAGDPGGKVVTNLSGDISEFHNHIKSKRGYYGADYNIAEANKAHDGINNWYSVSNSVISADVFINVPKLKTHKKAAITCCLKNLVGINTYKNFLPHYSEGGPEEKGDQFPVNSSKSQLEGHLMAFIKQNLIRNVVLARLFRPVKQVGKVLFGDTNKVIRSGNWYGNDTIWRMILDLNKILFYANPNGSLRNDNWINAKKYIGIVDGIKGGDGNGPMAPDPVGMGYLFQGLNPVAIDSVCAVLMGFDPNKIPSVGFAFHIKRYPVCDFNFQDIQVKYDGRYFGIDDPYLRELIVPFNPHFGWAGHIETTQYGVRD